MSQVLVIISSENISLLKRAQLMIIDVSCVYTDIITAEKPQNGVGHPWRPVHPRFHDKRSFLIFSNSSPDNSPFAYRVFNISIGLL